MLIKYIGKYDSSSVSVRTSRNNSHKIIYRFDKNTPFIIFDSLYVVNQVLNRKDKNGLLMFKEVVLEE